MIVTSGYAPLATPRQLQYIITITPLHPSLCPYSSGREEIRTLILAIIYWYLLISPSQFGELTPAQEASIRIRSVRKEGGQ